MNASPQRAPAGAIPPRYVRPLSPVIALAMGASVFAGALTLYLFNPAQFHFYPVCYFHQTTGLLCPGCGGLRALHQLSHGHLALAWRHNALVIASLPVVGWWTLRLGMRKWRRQPAELIVPAAWLWAGLGLLLLFGILRNLSFAPFAWMAP